IVIFVFVFFFFFSSRRRHTRSKRDWSSDVCSSTCGYAGVVTELVLAFPPGGTAGRSAPASHVSVVALLDAPPFAGGAGSTRPALSTAAARTLARRVADRAEQATRGPVLGLLHPLALDADQAADAGEVVALGS